MNKGSKKTDPVPKELPIACELTGSDFEERLKLVREIHQGAVSTAELPDGYQWTFPGTDSWLQRVFGFIGPERKCCRFLRFELVLEPDEGPIHLTLRGGPEVKSFLTMNLGSSL